MFSIIFEFQGEYSLNPKNVDILFKVDIKDLDGNAMQKQGYKV